jgi:hypothetical protein
MRLLPSLLLFGTIVACHGAWPRRAEASDCTVSVYSDTSRLSAADAANPQLQALIGNAEAMALEQFSALFSLLNPHRELPEKLEARLVYLRQADGIAWASGGEITVNVKWFTDNPQDVGALYHELAHVVQSYPANPQGGDYGWLVEGIADWARYFVYEGHDLAFYADRPAGSYRDAYTNAARFLEWLRLQRNPDIVTELNARLTAGTYNPARDWTELGGSRLDELWAAYAADGKAARP